MKLFKRIVWNVVVYGVLLALIWMLISSLIGMIPKAPKEIDPPVDYQVVFVIGYKENDNVKSNYYHVRIDKHEYIMCKNNVFESTLYKHHPKCKYCTSNNTTKYNTFSFSTLDGLDSKMLNTNKKLEPGPVQ